MDNDCVPVTLFEVQDLLQLAHQQHQWVDLMGCVRLESSSCAGTGMLLFTEAHLDIMQVWSFRQAIAASTVRWSDTTASTLAKNLQAGRLALVSRARPPVNPSDTFFFHEYGRRVGMVPRSSLKGGKNSQMVEKRTRKPNTTQNQPTPQPGPTGRVSTIM